ncbi:choline kinase alpha [Nephila pilipes]|uniref:Choline kinase alpha n=1 Tax=Nephila pilipes TaxID=299642 RepID=A0A8X6TJM7_NEPPI|nr:choline kinase alpha [Nephila pilipes]
MPRSLFRSLTVFDKLVNHNHPTKSALRNSVTMLYTDSSAPTYQVKKMRDQAYRICRDYLSGSWKSISSSDMVFRSISGGMSNFLYYCSLPETHTPLVGEPHQVLMRMYGQIHEGVEAKVTESVIFMMLSERNLGPKLYGIFPGGRLEEYIPARAMTCDELKAPEMSATIARKLAKVHTLNVPINKEPKWLFDKMQNWMNFAKNEIRLENLNDEQKKIAVNLLSQDFEKEFVWLRNVLIKANSPVLFCHNDLQEGNILVPERASALEDKIVFIDFEYCSYNFRAFDIANHFCEWCFDYSNPNYPHFSAKEEEYPAVSQQLNFIRSYLRNFESSCNDNEVSDEINNEDHVLKEVLVFTLASHFLWTLWSIVNAQNSQIEFGYWEYGKARWDAYIQHKSRVLKQEDLDFLLKEER